MDLRAQILKEHSKANADKIAAWVGNDQKRFSLLLDLFLHDEYRVVQRSSQIITKIGDLHPQLIIDNIDTLVNRMAEPGAPVAVKRNVIRLLQFVPIPEHLHSIVMNTCFDLLADVKETVAVRAFSMTVLANLAKFYPDIKQELAAIIEDQLELDPTPGFKTRGQKVLAQLKKIS